MNTPTSQVEEISHLRAIDLLRMNTSNRPMDIRRANRIAKAIQRGEWVVNGDAIRISDDGVLLDGQHRLKAIAISGCTVNSFVARNLPSSVFNTIDVGSVARTFSNVLALQGEKYYSVAAAIARMMHIYRQSGNPCNGNPDFVPTPAQLSKVMDDTPSIRVAAEIGDKFKWCRKNLTPTTTGFCMSVFMDYDKDLALNFFSLLNSGIGLQYGSPILLLRERMAEAALNSKVKMGKHYKVALIFKAFKLFRDGASVKHLRVRLEGDSPETDIFIL